MIINYYKFRLLNNYFYQVIYREKAQKRAKKAFKEIWKFKNLFLGSEFEELKTRRRLVEESLIQNNYCWHYVNAINRNKSRIFSTIYQNNRYTLEIRKSKNKFMLNKLYGANYMSPPNELEENIEKRLAKLHRDINGI